MKKQKVKRRTPESYMLPRRCKSFHTALQYNSYLRTTLIIFERVLCTLGLDPAKGSIDYILPKWTDTLVYKYNMYSSYLFKEGITDEDFPTI